MKVAGLKAIRRLLYRTSLGRLAISGRIAHRMPDSENTREAILRNRLGICSYGLESDRQSF